MKKNIALMMLCSSFVSVYANYEGFNLEQSFYDSNSALTDGQVVQMFDNSSSASSSSSSLENDFLAIGDTNGRRIIQADMNELAKEAAIAASAAYNDRTIVGLFSTPTRSQEGNFYKEQIAQTQEVITFSSDSRNGPPAGFVSYKEDATGKAQITIAFAGTEDFKDLRTDANALWGNPASLGLEGKIHAGFLNRYNANRQAMLDVLEMVLEAHNKSIEDVSLLFTGHSLGGALATIAATDIKQNVAKNVRDVNLVTFSSPRVGDEKFAKHATNLLRETRIITLHREGDPVPGIAFGAHVGQVIQVPAAKNNTSITNHQMELYMNDLHHMDAQACKIGVEAPGTFSTVFNTLGSAGMSMLSATGSAVKNATSYLNPFSWGWGK